MLEHSKKDLITYAVLGFAGLAMLAMLYFDDPSREGTIFPPCPTHYISDIYCPGCGSLRAMHALVHGNFAEAASQNILTLVFLPILVLMVLFPKAFAHKRFPLAVLLIIAVFTVLRNFEAFSFLAPH